MQRIRTLSEIPFEFSIFTNPTFKYQELSGEAKRLRRLGMSYRAIGEQLGIDMKLARKAVLFRTNDFEQPEVSFPRHHGIIEPVVG